MKEHIDEVTLRRFIDGCLSEQEQMKILEHLAICDECALIYSELMEKHLIKAPMDMKDSIMEQSRRIPTERQKKRLIFYQYCTKIGIGMVASLIFLFGNSNINTKISEFQVNTHLESIEFATSIQEKLQEFQNQFSNTIREEKYYD